jgi:hypothetical protein
MNKIRKIFLIYLLLVSKCSIADKLRELDWNLIQEHCLGFIVKNKNHIKIETNESGFYRIKVDLGDYKNKGIIDIRINYWMDDKRLNLETIHSHPNHFESKIIKGGYVHEIFYQTNSSGEKYNVYTINRNLKNKKIFINKGISYLKSYGIFSVNQNNKIGIDQKLIHRIIDFKKDTLSINVVFGHIEKSKSEYKLFVKKDQLNEKDINSRTTIENSYNRYKILNNIIKILSLT